MYTVSASTAKKSNAFTANYIDDELATWTFNQLITAQDATEVSVIDGFTGEVHYLWFRSKGFVVIGGISVS